MNNINDKATKQTLKKMFKNNKKKKDNKKENICDINNKMNNSNNKKESININKENNNIDNILNLNNYSVNPYLSEKENLNLFNIEDNKEENKKNKHSSSFQQATEIIHSIQSFFHSFKKSNSNNDSLLDNPSSSTIKKQSLSDSNIENMDKTNVHEESNIMEKLKIQRSKSIPFNNTNTTQRNSCHYHKHSSLSSMTSSITSLSINHDSSHHCESENETIDSRLEYSTPKENDFSFSFSSCQSSFSFSSAFTNKMIPMVNNHISDSKAPLPLSPKSINSNKSDILSVTPHVIEPLEEEINEPEILSQTETILSLPLDKTNDVIKQNKHENRKNSNFILDKDNMKIKNTQNVNKNDNESIKDNSLDSLSNTIPPLLNQYYSSSSSTSKSSISVIDTKSIQPLSPSLSSTNISNESLENNNQTQCIKPSQIKSLDSNSKSPELFNVKPLKPQLNITSSKGKSMLLFSSPSNDHLNSTVESKVEKESPISGSEISTSEEKCTLSYKDVVVNNLINNSKSSSRNNNISNSENDKNKENKSKKEESKNYLEIQDTKEKPFNETIRSRPKDNAINPLYSNIINEDTLIDSENSSFISNIINVSESESTSVPNTNNYLGDVQKSLDNKNSNLIIEDLDNTEEFIHISSSNELDNDSLEDIQSNKKDETIITIEDANESTEKSQNPVDSKISSNHSLTSSGFNINKSNDYALKERDPNENLNNKDREDELIFSKETTSSIAINNTDKRDEDNYSYYSNAFSPEISISSVTSDEKYIKNFYEKPQFYRKNKNGKKVDYEKSLKEYALSLEKDMMDFYTKNLPTEESKTRKLSLLKRIQKIFSDRYPTLGIKAHLFGSSANELGTYNSDVDICLTTKGRVESELNDMEVIKKILEENGITQVRTTPNAKVPICNFVDPETQLSCDINVNNTIALYNTKMIQTYALIDERVKPLIMTIKYFAKQRMLSDAKTGTLSSYCWVNMVINFLQMRKPPILPCLHAMTKDIPEEERIIVDGIDCTIYTDLDKLKGFGKDNKETLYELIFGFFKTFACDFDYITDVVSVRSGCYKKKSDNGWNVSSNNTRIRNNYFCVEEPFTTTRNLANSANRFSVKGLRWEFKRAFKILKARGSLEELCEPYKPNPSNYSYDTTYYYPNQNRIPIENGKYNIHNDHLFLNNTNNAFTNYKNGKNTNQYSNSLTMADKNGNWRIRNNNGNNSTVNNISDNTSFQNKKVWNIKKKTNEVNDNSSNNSVENFYYARRFPNDNSFMNNHYNNSPFINNKRNNYNNNNKNNYSEKDIHNRKNEKSPYHSNKDMDETDNEKPIIKHRFIEHHRNFDNSFSSPFSSSSHYYYSNNNNNNNLNNYNNTTVTNTNNSNIGNNNTKSFNHNKIINNTNNTFSRNNNSNNISYPSNNTNVNNKENLRNTDKSNSNNTTNVNEKQNMDQTSEKKKLNKVKTESRDDVVLNENDNENIDQTKEPKNKEISEDENMIEHNKKNTKPSVNGVVTESTPENVKEEASSLKSPNNSTNPVIINNYYSYINQEYSAQYYKQLGYIVQDPKLSLTDEGINKQQSLINSARYPSYPIFINLSNSNNNAITTNNHNNGSSSSSNQSSDNKQTMVTGFAPSYPVLGSNSYGHYYTKVNNVNLINYYIPAPTTSHPPGSPYQSRTQPLGYTVEAIPIIPATGQTIYNVASNNNISIPEGGLYHTYHSIVPVVVDNSMNPVLSSHENLANENNNANNEKDNTGSELEDKNDIPEQLDGKNDRNNVKHTFNNKKFSSSSKSENKKSQWPNSQFHSNKTNKKISSENSHKNGKQKSKEEEQTKDGSNQKKKTLAEDNRENHNIKRNSKIENFAIKNTNKSDGPTEFSLADRDSSDVNQSIISVDSTKSEEERTLYNEELCCEPGQMDSDDDDLEPLEDTKGQNSNINIRNNVTGSKGSEILLNIKNKNSSIEINLENNIIVNDVLIDYKNNKENIGKIISSKGKKNSESGNSSHDNKRNEKGKSSIKKAASISSMNSVNMSTKEKKNKKNNNGNNTNSKMNKEPLNKVNSQSKSDTKNKVRRTASNNGTSKNKGNNSKNNKKEESKGKRKNSIVNHKTRDRINSITIKDSEVHTNKIKENKEKTVEKSKGDETTVITTVTTTIITNNSNSTSKNAQNNKKDDNTKNFNNKKNNNKSNGKAKKQQKFNKKLENDKNNSTTNGNNNNNNNNNTISNNNTPNTTTNNNGSNNNQTSKKKFRNNNTSTSTTTTSSNNNNNNNNNTKKAGKAKVEDNNNKSRNKGNSKKLKKKVK